MNESEKNNTLLFKYAGIINKNDTEIDFEERIKNIKKENKIIIELAYRNSMKNSSEIKPTMFLLIGFRERSIRLSFICYLKKSMEKYNKKTSSDNLISNLIDILEKKGRIEIYTTDDSLDIAILIEQEEHSIENINIVFDLQNNIYCNFMVDSSPIYFSPIYYFKEINNSRKIVNKMEEEYIAIKEKHMQSSKKFNQYLNEISLIKKELYK